MRKLLCLLAVAMFVAPAFGGDITFTAVAGPLDNQFTIGYSATDPCDVPRAFALGVTLSGCDATVADEVNVVSTSAEFDVHIDYASEDPCNYTIGEAGQHPIADPCVAGVPAAATNVFSIVMGRLDPCAANDPLGPFPPVPASQSIASLVVIEVTPGANCTATVDIQEDNLRGGVVGAAFGSVFMVDGTVVVVPAGPSCPIACWLYPTQCHGDTDGDGDIDGTDWFAFRDAFGTNYATGWNGGAGPYNPCADLDHDGDIDGTDWFEFRDNFGSSSPPSDCPMTCVWPPL